MVVMIIHYSYIHTVVWKLTQHNTKFTRGHHHGDERMGAASMIFSDSIQEPRQNMLGHMYTEA